MNRVSLLCQCILWPFYILALWANTTRQSRLHIYPHTKARPHLLLCYCSFRYSFHLKILWFCGRWRSGLWHCATQSPNLSSYFNRQRFQRPLYMHPHERERDGERKRATEREKQGSWWDWMVDRKNSTPITQITLSCNLSYRSHCLLWGWLKCYSI